MYWDKIKIKELIKMHKYYMHVHVQVKICANIMLCNVCVSRPARVNRMA